MTQWEYSQQLGLHVARLSTRVHTTVHKGKQNVLDPNAVQPLKVIMHTTTYIYIEREREHEIIHQSSAR